MHDVLTGKVFKALEMLLLSLMLLCVTNYVEANLIGGANSSVPAVNLTEVSTNNKTNNTLSSSNSALNPAGVNASVSVNVTAEVAKTKAKETPVVDAQAKAEEMPVLDPKDAQRPPLNGLFAKTPSGAALRGLYVFVGLSAVIMIYIAVKLIRLRRKKMKIRKYGLIANADDVEMTPLGADDDDEDTTLFDAHNHIGR